MEAGQIFQQISCCSFVSVFFNFLIFLISLLKNHASAAL